MLISIVNTKELKHFGHWNADFYCNVSKEIRNKIIKMNDKEVIKFIKNVNNINNFEYFIKQFEKVIKSKGYFDYCYSYRKQKLNISHNKTFIALYLAFKDDINNQLKKGIDIKLNAINEINKINLP